MKKKFTRRIKKQKGGGFEEDVLEKLNSIESLLMKLTSSSNSNPQLNSFETPLAPVSALRKAIKKEKRSATNPSGPTQWNEFVMTTWKNLVHAKLNTEIPANIPHADFIELAKTSGITYQNALAEAKRLKEES